MLHFKSFDWNSGNLNHIATHQVTPQETEEACDNRPLILKSRLGRYYVLGRTDSGRYLTVIVIPKEEHARVITARDMSESERQRYMRR